MIATGSITPTRQPVVGLADWLSPGRVLSLAQAIHQTVALVPGSTQLIAKNNPKRIGLYVGTPQLGVNTVTIGPFNLVTVGGIVLTGNQTTFAGVLTDFGSLICGEWYATVGVGVSIVVSELVRS